MPLKWRGVFAIMGGAVETARYQWSQNWAEKKPGISAGFLCNPARRL
jgi:hypothetical protein